MSTSSQVARSYLRRLEIRNLRGFRHLKLEVVPTAESPAGETVIVGRNGTNKTTLLRAIALGAADSYERTALLAFPLGSWVRQGEEKARIDFEFEEPDGRKFSRHVELFTRESRRGVSDGGTLPDGPIFVGGYGLGRGNMGADPSSDYSVLDSVKTLFKYEERLVHSELVLRRLNDFLGTERFGRLLAAVKKALGLLPEHDLALPQGGGIVVSGPGIGDRIPLEAWADGYRMSLIWMIDFFGAAMRANAFDEDGDICGILLIDEIEQHLHPSMQAAFLPRLRQALPKVQIFATTHSPLVALSSHSENLVALHRNGDEIHRAQVPDLKGYSAEDVLIESSLFGTDPYAADSRADLDRHAELQRIPPGERSSEEALEMRALAAELAPEKLPASREDPILQKLQVLEEMLAAKTGES